jgi:hypothetical protein
MPSRIKPITWVLALIAIGFASPLLGQQKGQWVPGQFGLNAGVIPGSKERLRLICALGSHGHTRTTSLHYWIMALSAMQGAMSRSRLGSTIVLEC